MSKIISPLENLIDFKVPLSFIGRLQMKSSSLAFLESRESQCPRQERLPHVFLGTSYGKIIVFKTGILKSPGDEKLVSLCLFLNKMPSISVKGNCGRNPFK